MFFLPASSRTTASGSLCSLLGAAAGSVQCTHRQIFCSYCFGFHDDLFYFSLMDSAFPMNPTAFFSQHVFFFVVVGFSLQIRGDAGLLQTTRKTRAAPKPQKYFITSESTAFLVPLKSNAEWPLSSDMKSKCGHISGG